MSQTKNFGGRLRLEIALILEEVPEDESFRSRKVPAKLAFRQLVSLTLYRLSGDFENAEGLEVDEFDHRRLDIAAIDGDGNVVIAMEAERINHDARRAIPKDFDKMAECEPDEAIWIAMSHDEAHDILAALNDPLEGEPRVEKTYAKGTPADQFQFDEPGCTGMYTLEQVREMVEERQ